MFCSRVEAKFNSLAPTPGMLSVREAREIRPLANSGDVLLGVRQVAYVSTSPAMRGSSPIFSTVLMGLSPPRLVHFMGYRFKPQMGTAAPSPQEIVDFTSYAAC